MRSPLICLELLAEEISNQIEEDEQQDDTFSSQLANVHSIPMATSLGKQCNHTLECQIRDPYTHCVDGMCECIKKSSSCSASNTGKWQLGNEVNSEIGGNLA